MSEEAVGHPNVLNNQPTRDRLWWPVVGKSRILQKLVAIVASGRVIVAPCRVLHHFHFLRLLS